MNTVTTKSKCDLCGKIFVRISPPAYMRKITKHTEEHLKNGDVKPKYIIFKNE